MIVCSVRHILTILTVLVLATTTAADYRVPAARGQVNDYAGLLDRNQQQRLETRLRSYRDQTGNEVAILILMSLDGSSIEDVAHNVFQKWGIGSKEQDNGVLFLVAFNEQRVRIEVGYGLEADLTDIECGRLVGRDSPMAESFRKRRYFTGVSQVLDGIEQAIGGEYNPPPSPRSKKKTDYGFSKILIFLLFLLFALFKAGMQRRVGFRVFGITFRDTGRSSGSGFTFGGGSGFGGGGFGGGSSGGGGASGGW
jgi:uncharacterized protein